MLWALLGMIIRWLTFRMDEWMNVFVRTLRMTDCPIDGVCMDGCRAVMGMLESRSCTGLFLAI